MSSTSLVTLLVLVGVFGAGIGVEFTTVIPKLLYYDSITVASVSAFDVDPTSKASVRLEYRGGKDNSRILNNTTLEFTSDGSKNWSVIFTWDHLHQLEENSVTLFMISDNNENKMNLPFSKDFGYIFIQTDKPLYTPRQTVRFRVIAIDEHQKLAKYKIRIEIKDHKKVIVDRKVITAREAFSAQDIKLPKETPPGNWSITASFEIQDHKPGSTPTLGSTKIVNFEVKEYILPTFKTDLEIRPDVITRTTKNFTISGNANYLYGKPVVGTVDIQLGIWDEDGSDKLFDNHYKPVLANGLFTQVIEVNTLFFMSDDFSGNKRLYVKVDVKEKDTSETVIFEDTSTIISNRDYVVHFEGSKKYFKPGFPYTLKLQVLSLADKPASSIKITVKSQHYNKVGQKFSDNNTTYQLDVDGKLTRNDIEIPNGAENCIFSVIFADQNDPDTNLHIYKVTKYISASNEYIQISIFAPKEIDAPYDLHLNYTKNTQGLNHDVTYKKKNITILVLAKGHIVNISSTEKTSFGSSNVLLYLKSEITPRMRIIAFYLGNKQEYIIDSLVVDTKHVCVEEVYLVPPDGAELYQPKQNYVLTVEGGSNMTVGLVAVDKAVLHLNNKDTLNRNSMFAAFGSHDTGSESGDGENMMDILLNSGLQHMSLTVNRPLYGNYYKRMMSRSEQTAAKTDILSLQEHAFSDSNNNVFNDNRRSYMAISDSSNYIRMLRMPDQREVRRDAKRTPPQTIRNDFPESWLFEEIVLPISGVVDLNRILPDSITTWSFMAVGLSVDRGICVSRPLEQKAFKNFFADVRLPYKAKRLEEVTLNITIYNYNYFGLNVTGTVTGSDGLCFLAEADANTVQNGTTFEIYIKSQAHVWKSMKVIPLRTGGLNVSVDLHSKHIRYNDRVMRTLNVVAEGQKVRKSITFVLDPETKHAAIESVGNKIHISQPAKMNNVSDVKSKKQQTTIDLSLPVEIIRGSEVCHIAAFGDLMGDIINYSVMGSRNLLDSHIQDAEEVLGDLAPAVYALLYANMSGLMDKKLEETGRKFIINGVVRLLKYRLEDNSFSLTVNSKPATWLTAFVLKTLCHASSLAFIDHETLIDKGFNWLSEQINHNGILNEEDWRLAKDSLQYRVMLTAEVLIAIYECNKLDKEQHLILQGQIIDFLGDNIDKISEPMVLAKVTYALMLSDAISESEEYAQAFEKLEENKKRNNQGHLYWSTITEPNESKETSFWYYKGAQASAIEATAYALIVYLNRNDSNADAIADWLVGQRNHNGAFIGAMDSTAAIQALSKYSLYKHGVKVDLCCNVSSERQKEYFHSFKFTEENAIHPASINNVPVGQVLNVLTKGQGLGQMQVNVEFNIPIDRNQKCPFVINVTVTKTSKAPTINKRNRNSLCTFCNIGCPNGKKVAGKVRVKVHNVRPECQKKGSPILSGAMCNKALKMKKNSVVKKPTRFASSYRQARSVYENQAASKQSICVNVCLRYNKKGGAAKLTDVQIEMLTGYYPVPDDLVKITVNTNVRHAVFDEVTGILSVQFAKIPCKKQICVTFRAVAKDIVGRLMPAIIEVKTDGAAAPQCVQSYDPPPDQVILPVFCSDSNNINKGECKCLSGLCSKCIQNKQGSIRDMVKKLYHQSKIFYKLQITANKIDQWKELYATVLSPIKTGVHDVAVGTSITLTTPKFCTCLGDIGQNSTEPIYLLAGDAVQLMDRKGNQISRYLLDEQSTFFRCSENDSRCSLWLQTLIGSKNDTN